MSDLHRKVVSLYGRTGSSDDEDEIICQRWQTALRDIAAGTFKQTIIRFPVILNPDGPVSSAEDLQQLIELESVPETLETIVVTENGADTERPIRICHISNQERERLIEKANILYDYTASFLILFEEKERIPIRIESLKEGVLLQRKAVKGSGSDDQGRRGDRLEKGKRLRPGLLEG
ncbi:uncharacterized protein P884DRAFT_264330 [Thermothelomyces heterothallicus CBS 202.75]|uniref:uncharacterized protein n=1 Tax=Thermothelomyces heterothallicus CBS 202.75 TaxID=1149848 RepID=UPI00374379AA